MKTIQISIIFLISMTFGYSQEIFLLKTTGKVVIGDTTQISTPGNYNLYVQNGILTEKVKVSLKSTSEWSDDAFAKCPPVSQVAESITTKSHLVEMPSAQTLTEEGYELKSMDAKLLQQIEWLWQHMIRLDEENKKLKEELAKIKAIESQPKH